MPSAAAASSSPGRCSITSERLRGHGELPEELTDGLRAQYLARLYRLETMTGRRRDLEDEVAATAQADLALRRDLIAFQRRTLSDCSTRDGSG